jgi:hypothetical protein
LAAKDLTKLLTNDDSVEVTVIDVVVLPVLEALALPISGIVQPVVAPVPLGHISASVFGMIFTS